jgi:hypothetical protein
MALVTSRFFPAKLWGEAAIAAANDGLHQAQTDFLGGDSGGKQLSDSKGEHIPGSLKGAYRVSQQPSSSRHEKNCWSVHLSFGPAIIVADAG